MSVEDVELRTAIQRILSSPSRKKLVVAGPGTGKTALFKELLRVADEERDTHLVLTFINNLRNDLEQQLSEHARVYTLHSYCLGLLHRNSALRPGLSSDFRCFPGLASLIKSDWKCIRKTSAPQFIRQMRNLETENDIPFYAARGEYYDAVDFDDTVYRVYTHLATRTCTLDRYNLVLIDEYQDFNAMEAGFIDLLAETSPILIVGDDDQALYSQWRDSSSEYIRSLYRGGEYERFELPFCMRCPQVVVNAVNDVIKRAQQLNKLEGRISKPYKHFPPAKGADSKKYPTISVAQTSVQRQNSNYMGQYIAQAISEIPADEIVAASREDYPAVLIIAANPYRKQITDYLEQTGYAVEKTPPREGRLDRVQGLEILKKEPESNLGWRVVLEAEQPGFLSGVIERTADRTQPLVNLLPREYRDRILAEVDSFRAAEEPPDQEENEVREDVPVVRITSFEGAKGLSAQHVFIAGLHNGEIPRDPRGIQDLEICKFIVGLTRARKKCSLLHTRRFAGKGKSRSLFISWIDCRRFNYITVDAAYWKKHGGSRV